MTVLRNSLARCNARHLRIKRLVQFIFADPVCNNALTNRAALLCRALRRVNRLCSSTVSGTANMSRHGSTLCSPTVEKLLCRSLFSERSHVGNLRQTLQGKRGDSQEGGKPQFFKSGFPLTARNVLNTNRNVVLCFYCCWQCEILKAEVPEMQYKFFSETPVSDRFKSVPTGIFGVIQGVKNGWQ